MISHAPERSLRYRGCTTENVRNPQIPSSQKPDAQSAEEPQGAPCWQLGAHHAGAHRLSAHTNDEQSLLSPHTSPVPQLGEHAAASQVPLALHTPDPQSASEPQGAPRLHVGAQCAGWQTPLSQTKEWHSPLWAQGAPVVPGCTEQLAQLASPSRIGRRKISAWFSRKVLRVSISFVPLAMNRPKAYCVLLSVDPLQVGISARPLIE